MIGDDHYKIALVCIISMSAINAAPPFRNDGDESCTCQAGGNFYTVVSESDCTTFKHYLDPDNIPQAANQQCASGTKFDISLCVCNHAALVSCPAGCGDVDSGGGGGNPGNGGSGGGSAGGGVDDGDCPNGYSYNPIADTCMRLVRDAKLDWDAASAACVASGETLAVFDTVDNIEWFKNLRATNETWRRYQLWIGGRSVGGAGLNPFKWYGRLTDGNGEGTQILFGDWEQVQPSYNGECIAVMDDRRSDVAEPLRENYKWNDAPCSAPKFYVCEKPESSS